MRPDAQPHCGNAVRCRASLPLRGRSTTTYNSPFPRRDPPRGFTKMPGPGNDYVYVDCVNGPPVRDPANVAVKVSDRHFGIGGDGLILICPSEVADARMRMFNPGGWESEMCGNGLRCVAKFVHDHGIARKPTLKLETGRG